MAPTRGQHRLPGFRSIHTPGVPGGSAACPRGSGGSRPKGSGQGREGQGSARARHRRFRARELRTGSNRVEMRPLAVQAAPSLQSCWDSPLLPPQAPLRVPGFCRLRGMRPATTAKLCPFLPVGKILLRITGTLSDLFRKPQTSPSRVIQDLSVPVLHPHRPPCLPLSVLQAPASSLPRFHSTLSPCGHSNPTPPATTGALRDAGTLPAALSLGDSLEALFEPLG